MRIGSLLVAAASVSLAWGAAYAQSSCQPDWQPTFGKYPGMDDQVTCMAVFDDGGGPALFVGGLFDTAVGTSAVGIARFDGTSWTAVGGGLVGTPHAMAVFDDGLGGGPALYVGGSIRRAGGVNVKALARWDGSAWSKVGSPPLDGANALAVFDDRLGGGPALYAGGVRNESGFIAGPLVKWNGQTWTTVTEFASPINALATYDDGRGTALYLAGEMFGAGFNRIARWNGVQFEALGSGMNTEIDALAVFDDGSGSALYAGGSFTSAGNRPASHIAKWNGTRWSVVGAGTNGVVLSLSSLDDGNGQALFVGGGFTTAGGAPAIGIARWSGSWSSVGDINLGGAARAMVNFDDGRGGGPSLYVGGGFNAPGGTLARNLTRWDGSHWIPLARGFVDGDRVEALAMFDDGSGGGPELYAGGYFALPGGASRGLLRWNGERWADSGGVVGPVTALTAFDDGSGPALYAAGEFTPSGGVMLDVGRFDGTSWSALVASSQISPSALAVFDDGNGRALYVGGNFSSIGGVNAQGIARWDGVHWSALGGGLDSGVLAMTVFDDGTGPALFAAGTFSLAGSTVAERIAKWDGNRWYGLATGITDYTRRISALAVFDDGHGGGPALYAAGDFLAIGGVSARRIARWDGAAWSSVGTGVGSGSPLTAEAVLALASFDDGRGPALFAGGRFATTSAQTVNNLVRWDGASWSALGAGTDGDVFALAPYDDRHGSLALCAAGIFHRAGDGGDSTIALWHGCDHSAPVLHLPRTLIVREQTITPPGAIVAFDVTASDDRDPAPTVVCVPRSGSFFSLGPTVVSCKATDAAGNVSAGEFTVLVRTKVR